jgi:hypothetical protein
LLDSSIVSSRDASSNFCDVAGTRLSVMHLIGAIPSAVAANGNAFHVRSPEWTVDI